MAITSKDLVFGIEFIEKTFESINYDKTTVVSASDIADFFVEYYPEIFEDISSDLNARARFEYSFYNASYYSYYDMAINMQANLDTDMFDCLAHEYCYDSYDEMYEDYFIISDVAIDGFVVLN